MKHEVPLFAKSRIFRFRNSGQVGIALILALLLAGLMCYPLSADPQKKQKPPATDPYSTAELDASPAVAAVDLAYKAVIFEPVKLHKMLVKDATGDMNVTLMRAISRLSATGAFTKVEKRGSSLPEEPYLLVVSNLLEYRIVSSSARIWGGALAGTSYLTCGMKIYDGKNNTLLDEMDVTTENNAFSAVWGSGDKSLPGFIGAVMGDYLILRARNDKGASIAPLEKVVPDGAVFTDPATQLTWSAKDSHDIATWDEAGQYAKDFKGGGFSDWRLPTEQELKGLYNSAKTTILKGGKKIHAIDGVTLTGNMCWTSEASGAKANYFDFEKGSRSSKNKTDPYSMRTMVVRSGK
jgi:hypothetical protein